MPFLKVSAWSETQTALSRIWTWVPNSIYDDLLHEEHLFSILGGQSVLEKDNTEFKIWIWIWSPLWSLVLPSILFWWFLLMNVMFYWTSEKFSALKKKSLFCLIFIELIFFWWIKGTWGIICQVCWIARSIHFLVLGYFLLSLVENFPAPLHNNFISLLLYYNNSRFKI